MGGYHKIYYVNEGRGVIMEFVTWSMVLKPNVYTCSDSYVQV